MSTICHGFVQNAWRKDICSNCFRVRDEHSETENSVKYNISETTSEGINNNGVNIPCIVPRNNNNKKCGNEMNALVVVGGGTENIGTSQSFPQKANRFQGEVNPPVATIINNNNNNNGVSPTSSSFGQQGSLSCIPRISNGMPNTGNGKFSGTNSNNNTSTNCATTTTKGYHIHSGLSGSKSSINSDGGYNNNHNGHNDSSTQSETNGQTRNAEGILTKATSQSSHLHSNQPQIVMQQGKGVMTNQHPSKNDNAGVIHNHSNNDYHHKQCMTIASSAAASAGAVSHISSTTAGGTLGRSASSSYIASKNIFNNAHTHTTTAVGSSICTTGYFSSNITSSAIVNSSNKATSSMNGNVLHGNASVASVSGSTGLSHPQSTNSIKRGSIVSSLSRSSPVLSLSSSSSSAIQSQKVSFCSGGSVASGTVVNSAVSNNNGIISGTSYHSRNLEDCDRNGVIAESNTALREVPERDVSNNSSNNSFSTSVSKGVILITSHNGMNRTRGGGGGGGVKPKEVTDGDTVLDRRKVGLSGVNSSTSQNGSSGQVMSSNGTVGKPTVTLRTASKGILRSKNGHRKREKNVRFPDEVVSVIGYGGGPSGMSDDEDDAPPDPLDSASVNEVMEKSSTTSEEKELHRVTQKNTNFNSIKTNLLGTTCIEIGPIVGCSGGKSMEGSSKPLVSIGTFETRKEPLRIHKKINEDSADDELNENTVEKHRKFTPRSSIVTEYKPPLPTSQAPTKVSSMPIYNTPSQLSANKMVPEIAKQHQTTVSSSSSRGSIGNNNKTALSSSTTINSISSNNSRTTVSSSKTSSSISTKNVATTAALSSENKGNGSSSGSTTTIEVNPEKTSSPCTMTSTNIIHQSSKDCVDASSSSTEISAKSKTSGSHGTSTVIHANRTTSSSTTSSSSSVASATTTKGNKWGNNNLTSCNFEGPSLRNKPVLKRIQQKNLSESSEGYTVNNAVSDISKSSTMSSHEATNMANLNDRNNALSIFNGGDKSKASVGNNNNNNNSIASKRSSFLRDCIIDSSSSSTTTMETATAASEDELNCNNDASASSGGVQVICKNNNGTGSGNHEEESMMIKSELKVDLKPSVNNGKLSHPPFGECLSNRSNGTDDSSEFDDSLEDSGLDIKKCSEISESDEKSGSGSDSGNENDYSDRDRVNIISNGGPQSGLFISVDEVEDTNKKPEKLSPDSVLFSSASEMSASGSSESIPEALDTVSNGSSQKSSSLSSSSSTSGSKINSGEGSGNAGGSSNSNIKRTAPRPPSSTTTIIDTSCASKSNNELYANSQATVVTVEGLYDDVSFYKNPMHFPHNKSDSKITPFEEEDEDENIYDDCTTASAMPNKGKSGGKLAIGSYNFQNGSRSVLDSDGEDELEKVVHRRSDGIEFIGIRKIDSESFLRERSPTPDRSPEGKRERSSSASPKTRRKVNQFFSTIGKRAGAAFSQHVHAYKNKSNSVIEDTGIEKSPSGSSSAYKRSMSTDEVSMTRTQEIYATLTPTSLKFKGLAPVLHKLSKMDLNMGDKDRGYGDDDGLDSKDKGAKKHKISSSIKKFLRFGSKDGSGEPSGNKYDFGNCQTKTETNGLGQMITTRISEEGMQEKVPSSRTPTPTKASPSLTNSQIKISDRKPYGTVAARPPPPPPPRVHSLDLLNRVGVVPNGTMRPARPPPPARHNRVAPSFTAVFNNPNADIESNKANVNDSGSSFQNHSDNPDPNNPPSKPKRKASMNLDCVTNGISRDLESTYNHITTLNLETLKLIASQTPMKIKRSTNLNRRSNSLLKWSHFQITESSKPLAEGHGFAFYSALLDDESCVLLIQESATAPNFSAPFEFPCVETSATFEDCIPDSFVTWKASEYVTNGSSVKVFVSVMPKYNLYSVENYMRHKQVPLLHKYFALLQAMTYWDKEEMSDLLVLVQSMEESESHFMANANTRGSSSDMTHQPSSPSSVLVYVHPIPHLPSSSSRSGNARSSSKSQLCADFENTMKQLLLNNGPNGTASLLGDNDRQVLMKRLCERKAKTEQDLFRLFLQVKLFAPKRDSEDLERIKKLRSERAIQQWLDKERALCMKEAVEQTLQRNVESSISPYKRSYLEFLLTPENSAKAVLDMLIDLLE